jgi:Family of unknown function (DUF6390)
VSVPGALLFARYAYPPNQLGYCGPDGAADLLRADEPAEIARRARRFEGAWSYLEFIARSAGVPDPLDEAVVEAYWVGNDLLDVDAPALVSWLRDRFAGQIGGTWRAAAARATAHHSFQVFEVYPWAAMLTRADPGSPDPAGPARVAVPVLDRCRIRTGVVLAVDGETATVRSHPLVWRDGLLCAGPAADEVVTWSAGGRSLLAGLAPGDRVSLHWDWVCDVLTDRQCARLEALEARQREALFGGARR